jgi:hypothetical protein
LAPERFRLPIWAKFRSARLSSIVLLSWPLLRRIVTEHVTDDARQRLAEKVVAHLELSGFEIDEQQRVIRKRDGGRGW